MIISEMKKGCKVGFFGIGRSNASLLRILPLEKCSVVLRSDRKIDRSMIPSGLRIEGVFEGYEATNDIDEDILVFSPSVRRDRPEFLDAEKRGVIFTSDAEIFFECCNKPVFAVTGSDGKSTTAALIEQILLMGGQKAASVGNMGRPMTEELEEKVDCFVCEASSFMLQYASPHVKRACLTSLTPNHLDWHKDFEEYKKTKINLLKNSDFFVISDKNAEILGARGIISLEKDFLSLKRDYAAEIYMTFKEGYILRNGERLIHIDRIAKKERHNIQNLMMAIAMTDGYANIEQIIAVAEKFHGLKHRCEKILSACGVDYFDSSIDTSPARTIATLSSLNRPVVIILGGKSKGLDYSILMPWLKKYAYLVILTGENREEILSSLGGEIDVEIIPDFENAVERGIRSASKVGALLLSPASASYDAFKSYEERGERFKELVLKLRNL